MKFYKIIGTVSLFIPEGRFKDIARKFYHLKILKKKIYAANTHEGLILYINDKKYYFEYSYLGIDISNLEISAIEGYFSRYLPKEGDIVIDVGAYRGVISLIMSKLVGEGGRVISFEPDPFNYKLLFDNKKRLNIKNLIIIITYNLNKF